MPRSTISEPHEHAMLAALTAFAADRAGPAHGFLVVLGPGHELVAMHDQGDGWPTGPARERVLADAFAALLYDPFDYPEYGWVQWHNIPLAIFERVIGPLAGPQAAGYTESGAFMV